MKTIRATQFRQKGITLYSFHIDPRELEPLCYVEAAARDNRKGLQRVTEPSRLKEIADFIGRAPNGILPNNIILNLTSSVQIDASNDGQVLLQFPSAEGDYAFVVDGQHRLFSFRDEYRKLASEEAFEIPVVALHNATDEQVGETFVQINVNQKPVNRDLLIQMKAILGLLDTDIDKASVELIHALDDDPESPLHNRILRFPKEQNKWVKVAQLAPIVKALLVPGGALYEKTHAERKRILNEYFAAIRDSFPDAWADDKSKNYSLLTPTGLQMILGVLPETMQRCDFYEGFSYTSETFTRQLEPLQALAILGDWSKGSVQEPFGVKPRREMFLGQLKEALRIKPPSSQ